MIDVTIPNQIANYLGIHAPGISIEKFQDALQDYIEGIERTQAEDQEASRHVTEELEQIAREAMPLANTLSGLSPELHKFLTELGATNSANGLVARLTADLRALMEAAEMAPSQMEIFSLDADASPDSKLIIRLAATLLEGGFSVSAHPEGPLVRAYDCAKFALGETSNEPARIVKDVLNMHGGKR